MFDLKHLYRAGHAHGRQHGLLPSVGFPPNKWKLSQSQFWSHWSLWWNASLARLCLPFQISVQSGALVLYLALFIWALPSFLLLPINRNPWTMDWYRCCWYCGADLGCGFDVLPLFDIGNPWFPFIWAVTIHATAHPSSFSIPDSASWFCCFSDPLFSLQCLILDLNSLRFGSEKSLIKLWWFLYSWHVINLVFLSDGWSTTTLESVPQNDLPKTWATFIFTTGYQVRPQIYHLALRSHKPF